MNRSQHVIPQFRANRRRSLGWGQLQMVPVPRNMCAKGLSAALLGMILLAATAGTSRGNSIWNHLLPGLGYAAFHGEMENGAGEFDISILRINPAKFRFKLLTASENNNKQRTIKDWVQEFGLLAGINASMFWEDRVTSTGFMKNFDRFNNTIIHPDYGAFLVFNPRDEDSEPVKLIDRANTPNWRQQIRKYHTVVQNFRMISSKQKNVWVKKSRKFSVAALGQDLDGQILFIFSKNPSSIHELNNRLLELPIQIQNCMFVEGGPVASMYVNNETMEKEWAGLAKTTFWSQVPGRMYRIPNVIGIVSNQEESEE